jgi:hypothetical protein
MAEEMHSTLTHLLKQAEEEEEKYRQKFFEDHRDYYEDIREKISDHINAVMNQKKKMNVIRGKVSIPILSVNCCIVNLYSWICSSGYDEDDFMERTVKAYMKEIDNALLLHVNVRSGSTYTISFTLNEAYKPSTRIEDDPPLVQDTCVHVRTHTSSCDEEGDYDDCGTLSS